MDGLKEKVQKRIILGSISEINVSFKGEFPSLKIEFSTFASLRPKWCMPVAVANHTIVSRHLSPKCNINNSSCQPISQII